MCRACEKIPATCRGYGNLSSSWNQVAKLRCWNNVVCVGRSALLTLNEVIGSHGAWEKKLAEDNHMIVRDTYPARDPWVL